MNERLRTDSQETKIPSSETAQEVVVPVVDNKTYAGDVTSDVNILEDATTEETAPQDWYKWFDAQAAFFDSAKFQTAEIPTAAKLLEKIDEGKLSVDTLRENYAGMFAQYEALQPILNEALLPFDVTLPSRETFAEETPRMRRALEAKISDKLKESPTQFVPWITKMLTRLTVLTEACTTYEEVAEELGISLTEGDVDSVEKAA